MPTITAQSIIDKAEIILQDTTNVRWPLAELLGWLNDGQREIVALRPDTFVKIASVALIAGTRQAIPSDGYQLVKITRNMGVSGSTPGKALRKVPHAVLDAQVPNWHSAAAATTIDHFVFDPRSPKVYFVYPPSTGTTQVEIVYSASPTDVAAAGNTITLDDIYSGALMDYIMYRAYSKDFTSAGNPERAAAHRQLFENTLGLKAQADAASIAPDAIQG